MTPIRVGVAQLDVQLWDVEGNVRLATSAITEAADANCQLIVLPELANVGYINNWSAEFAHEYYRRAEPVPGPFSDAVAGAAKRCNAYVVVGMAERAPNLDGVLYNSALLVGPNGAIQRHRKIHLPREEKRYFAEGDQLEPITTDLGRIGLLICADNSFPEAARLLSLRGAQILAIPYAAHRGPNPLLYPQMAAVRAYENQVFVACANRCGIQGGEAFAGTSAIAGPDGVLLAQLGETEPGVVWADLDLDLIVSERLRQTRYRDRRPHLYTDIAKL